MKLLLLSLSMFFMLAGCTNSPDTDENVSGESVTKAVLGEKLYEDTNLSMNKTQACATCHVRDHAFIDPRETALGDVTPVSLGDDNASLGDRNAPTAGYAQLAPDFHVGTQQRFDEHKSRLGDYVGALGGQFVDGRKLDLAGQASGPPLNPVEMGMPDKPSVVARIMEDAFYVEHFRKLFGDDIFERPCDDDYCPAYNAMAEAIGEFEKTDEFAPFDSKYDLYLKGEAKLSLKEFAGMSLFFSGNMNCGACHQLQPAFTEQETFTSFEYHNLGVPENVAVRNANGSAPGFVDNGLGDFTLNANDNGKFKVPTLRNVAVTGPYMHNGVFRELHTVLAFYNHLQDRGATEHATNPETLEDWGDPEVVDNQADTELQTGNIMSSTDMDNMECFLRTLTDAKFEHLLPDTGLNCGD